MVCEKQLPVLYPVAINCLWAKFSYPRGERIIILHYFKAEELALILELVEVIPKPWVWTVLEVNLIVFLIA